MKTHDGKKLSAPEKQDVTRPTGGVSHEPAMLGAEQSPIIFHRPMVWGGDFPPQACVKTALEQLCSPGQRAPLCSCSLCFRGGIRGKKSHAHHKAKLLESGKLVATGTAVPRNVSRPARAARPDPFGWCAAAAEGGSLAMVRHGAWAGVRVRGVGAAASARG